MSVHSTTGEAPRPGSLRDEAGMVASEYAVGTLGACGVACALITMAPGCVDFFSAIFERAFSPIIPGLL